MGEGNTPTISLPTLARKWGVNNIWAKAEYLNPTGSYKDRIARTTMIEALSTGRRGWLGTSSGNGGAAMSAYGARAGLPGILCVLADAPAEKLASIRPYGILMIPMKKLGTEEMLALKAIAEEENLILTITAYAFNPEGMKGAEGIGEEIADQGIATHVYVPSGGGGLLAATATGLARHGSQAKVICAQPSECSPISRVLMGDIDTPLIPECRTRISGLQLTAPPDGLLAIEKVNLSKGWGVRVTDEAAWQMQDLLASEEGVFVEPASALALAALHQDIQKGQISSGDEPIVVLTGSGLKDMTRFKNSATSNDSVFDISEIHKFVQKLLATKGEKE
jgi:threonine synthase